MRSIELVGADLSRGSIIIWQTGSDVNRRRTGELGGEGSEMKGIERAKGKEKSNENANYIHLLY